MTRKAQKGLFVFLGIIFLFNELAFSGTVTGTVSTKKIKIPKDILVYVEKVKGKEFPPPEEKPVMDQVKLVFIPRVMPVVKGTTVRFKNSDSVKHNVFAVGDDEFDLGTWKGGDRVETYTFNKLGEVAVLCNVHPEMEAYVVVLQNPYFALTNEKGNYKIEDVPSGTYTLKTWHDQLRPVTKEVEVSGQGETVVGFEIKR